LPSRVAAVNFRDALRKLASERFQISPSSGRLLR
jgi:hypothetical protein